MGPWSVSGGARVVVPQPSACLHCHPESVAVATPSRDLSGGVALRKFSRARSGTRMCNQGRRRCEATARVANHPWLTRYGRCNRHCGCEVPRPCRRGDRLGMTARCNGRMGQNCVLCDRCGRCEENFTRLNAGTPDLSHHTCENAGVTRGNAICFSVASFHLLELHEARPFVDLHVVVHGRFGERATNTSPGPASTRRRARTSHGHTGGTGQATRTTRRAPHPSPCSSRGSRSHRAAAA